MRLFSLADASAVDDPVHGHFEAGEHGGFDFPGEMSARLHRCHVRGVRQWETDIERQHRLIAEEAARRQDPATLLAAVEMLVKQAHEAAQPAPAPEPDPAPAPEGEGEPEPAKPPRKTAAKP